MNSDLFFENIRYISVKDASTLTGYSKDYIGQLCRQDKILSKRIGRIWYVGEDSIITYKNTPATFDFAKNLAPHSVPASIKNENVVDLAQGPTASPIKEVLKSTPEILTTTELSKSKKFVHEALFGFDTNIFVKIIPFVMGLVLAIGFLSVLEAVQNTSDLKSGLSDIRDSIRLEKISDSIATSPSVVYAIANDVVNLYSEKMFQVYTNFGTTIQNIGLGTSDEIKQIASNPPFYISSLFKEIAYYENKKINTVFLQTYDLFAGASSRVARYVAHSVHDEYKIASGAHNTTRDVVGATILAVTPQTLNPVDSAGVVVYQKINSFFDTSVYSPLARFFGAGNTTQIVSPTVVPVIKKVLVTVPSAKPTTTNSQVVVNNTHTITERVVEKIISSDLTRADFETRLEELNNKIMSKLSALSTGSGGSVTNIYREIAQSQRIDQLTNTVITNPSINGGSISGTNISATSLSVSGTGTSTFAGGIDVSSGCVSVNGVCITAGGGGSGNVAVGLAGQFPYYDSNGTTLSATSSIMIATNGNIGIGTSSPYESLSVVGNIVSNKITTTGIGTSTFAGAIDVTRGINLNNGYFYGAGLSSCSAAGSKLLWNSVTGQFSCGLDAGSTAGIGGLGAQYSSLQIGSSQTFATSSADANIKLTITSSGDIHTFTPSWFGTLSPSRGGTGQDLSGASGILNFYNGVAGTIATSSLGLLTTNITEGSNLYYTDVRARGAISNSALGLTYTSGTGVFSLTSGFTIPLTASTTEWATAYLSRISSATYPLQISSNTLSLAFGTTTANSWSLLQSFAGNASTTGFSTGYAYFGTTATSSFSNTGALSLGGVSINSLLSTNANGIVVATSTPTFGNFYATSTTATSTIAWGLSANLLNITSTIASSTFANGINLAGGCYAIGGSCLTQGLTTAITSLNGLVASTQTFATTSTDGGFGFTSAGSTHTLNIPTASASSLGLLSSADWTTFNSKVSYTDTAVNTYIHASTTIPKTYTSNVFTNANTFTSTFALGTLNGPLQANNGIVSATTSVGVLYGGTGLTSYTSGDTLYADANGNLAKLPKSSNGLVLKLVGGFPSWQSDLTTGGGGGATAWSTSTNNMLIYPTDTSNVLVLGASATSTTGNLFEVFGGNSLFGGNIKVSGELLVTSSTTLQKFSATQATTSSLAITGIISKILKTDTNGSVVSAILGTDYESPLTFGGGLTRTVNNIAPTSGFTIPLTASTTEWATAYLSRISSATYPLQISSNTLSLAFGTTTANSWGALQTFTYSSTTYASFITASTTNLIVNGSSFNNLLGSGLSNVGGTLTNSGVTSILAGSNITISGSTGGVTINATGSIGTSTNETAGQLSYWTTTNGTPARLGSVATTTLTATGALSLSQPISVIGATPSILTCATANTTTFGCLTASDFSRFNSATTTFSTGLTYTNVTNAVTVNTTQNITTLSNLTTNGFLYTANSTGILNVAATSSIFGFTPASNARLLNTTYPLLGGGDLTGDRTFSLAFGTTTANSWSALQSFTNASSSLLSANYAQFGGTATSTFTTAGWLGVGSTTPGSLFSIGSTGTGWNFFDNATTTSYAKGIDLKNGGCFAINGTCIGGSSFTNTLANGGTATTTFYSGGVVFSDGSKLTQAGANSSFFWDNTNARLGLGTSTPWRTLSVNGSSDLGTNALAGSFTATSTTATSTFAGNITIGPYTYANNNSLAGGVGYNFLGTTFPVAATGQGSFAFGYSVMSGSLGITARGDGSMAVGAGMLTASGPGSIALGYGDAHFGSDIVSSGTGSFAAGYSSTNSVIASGNGSFAFGNDVRATNSFSTAFGTGFTNSTANTFQVGYSSTPTLTVNATKVGIGSTTPGSLLSIGGNGTGWNFFDNATTTSYAKGIDLKNGGCFAIGGTCIGTGSSFTNTLANGGTATTTFYSGGVVFSDGTKLTQAASASSFFWDNTNNRLGLGTSSPWRTLSVNGSSDLGTNALAGSFTATSTTATSTFAGNVTFGPGTYASNNSFAGGFGFPNARPILASGLGSLAFGYTGASGSSMRASNSGSIALGYGEIHSTGVGSLAFGAGTPNIGGGIYSTGEGSFAGGYASTNDISAFGDASFAFGDGIGATNYLSTAFGTGFTNSTANTFQVGYSSTPTLTVNATSLGIGTTSPGSILAVQGVANFTTATSTFQSTGGVNLTSGCFAINGTCVGSSLSFTYPLINTANTISLAFGTSTANSWSALQSFTNASSSLLSANRAWFGATATSTFSSAGWLGIGTTTPGSLLSVQGVANFTAATTTFQSTGGINLAIGGCYAIDGQCIATSTGAGGSPGGFSSQIQFNNSGTFSATSNFVWDNSNTRLGIASSTPWARLSVDTTSLGSTPAFIVGTPASTALIVDSSGNVGVNTRTPAGRLNVRADSSDSAALVVDMGSTNNPWAMQFSQDGFSSAYVSLVSDFTLGWEASLNPYLDNNSLFTLGSTAKRWKALRVGTGTSSFEGSLGVGLQTPASMFGVAGGVSIGSTYAGSNAAPTDGLLVQGNVGIGTTTPGSILSIGDTTNYINLSNTSTSTFSKGVNLTSGCFAVGGTCLTNFSNTLANGGTATTTFYSGGVVFSDGSKLTQAGANSSFFWDNTNARLGLGSTTPWAQLSINPNALGSRVPEFVIGSSTATHFVVDGGGNVGIGVTNPSALLVISKQSIVQTPISGSTAQFVGLDANPLRITFDTHNNTNTSGTALMFRRSRGTSAVPLADILDDVLGSLNFRGYGTTGYAAGSTGLVSAKAEGTFTDTSMPTAITFDTTPSGSVTALERLRITGAGNVGIGNSLPTGLLDLKANSIIQNLFNIASTSGTSLLSVGWYGDLTQNISSTSAVNIQDGSGNSVFAVDTTQSSTNAGLDITAGGAQTGNLLNVYSSGSTLLSGISAFGGWFQNIASTTALSLQNGSGVTGFNFDTLGTKFGIGSTTANALLSVTSIDQATDLFDIASTTYATSLLRMTNAGLLGLASSTPWGLLSLNPNALGSGVPEFVIGSSTATHLLVDGAGRLGLGTTTPQWLLNPFSATASQLALSAGSGIAQWAFRNAGGNLYFATTTVAGTSTTTISALTIMGATGNIGIGTTTPGSLLSVQGIANFTTATSTFQSTGGVNLTSGCFAIGGTCLTNFVNTLANGGTATTTFYSGGVVFSDGTKLTQAGANSSFFWDNTNKNLGLGTSTPMGLLTLQGAGTAKDLLAIASTTNGIPVLTVNQWGGFVQRIASTSAFSIQTASGTPVFEVDTTQSNSNAGIDITSATGQTSNLLNMYSSGGTFLSGFTASGGLFMNISSTTALNMFDGSGNAAFVVNTTGKSIGVGTSTLAYAFTVQDTQASTYVARIDNASTNTDADGLLITLGVANASRTTSNYFVGFATGDKTVAGKIQGGASAVAYTTTAADLAEFFRISDLTDKPTFGEIVVLDKNKQNSVVRAQNTGSATTTDAVEPLGIVSTNPGFVGNGPICLASDTNCDKNYAEYNVLVSLTGQVPVKISESNGPIKVGDYLTLSTTTPGVAVKMLESGYIIGTAVSEATTTVFNTSSSNSATSTSYSEKTATVFIKNGWRDIAGTKSLASSDGSSEALIPTKWFGLFEFFKQIGFEIGNGVIKIANLVTDTVLANKVQTKQLCIDDVCVNKAQLQAMLMSSNTSGTQNSGSGGTTGTTTPPTDTSSPVVTVTGINPAEIPVGSTYSDNGATVTDINADGTVNNNLGYKIILDGTEVTDVTIDTTATSTHTIIYRATDGAGNVGEASRTVNVVEQ